MVTIVQSLRKRSDRSVWRKPHCHRAVTKSTLFQPTDQLLSEPVEAVVRDLTTDRSLPSRSRPSRTRTTAQQGHASLEAVPRNSPPIGYRQI